jgi:hypothetical protein
MKRLNIIKILSHKRWKLTKETLKSLYSSLIGFWLEFFDLAVFSQFFECHISVIIEI